MMTMRRRDKGSGYLARKARADGRWAASYVGSDGRRHYISGQTKADAREKLGSALRDKAQGLFVAGPSQTVAQFLADWLRQVPLRPRSRQRYEGVIRLHIVPAIGDVPLRKLTPQHIARIYVELAERGRSAHNVHAVLSGAMKQAVQWNLIARNPVAAVRSPKSTRRELVILEPDEIRALLRAARGDPFETLYVLAVYTGLRQGELLALRWGDIDLERAQVDVNATLSREDREWVRAPLKTATSRRTVALAEPAIAALREHRVREAERLLAFGYRLNTATLLFTDRWGDPINGFHVTERRLKPLMRQAGLRVIRFHDLRHCCASLLLSEGVRPDVVSRMLGHSSPAMTMTIYAHLMPGDQETAVALLAARLRDVG